MEGEIGFEPTDNGFAGRRISQLCYSPLSKAIRLLCTWCPR
nr:MAG TPA: hypothetical protein [Bacteriophage sp.]